MIDTARFALLLAMAALFLAPAGVAAQADSASARPVSIKGTGYIQLRETARPDAGLTATLNRARAGFDVQLPAGWSARITAEFSGSAGAQLRDGYVRWTKDAWNAQAGQFKTPMALESLTSLADVETPDRAAVVDSLSPRRDIGLQLAWSPDPSIEAFAGVFNGEGQNVTANRDSTVLVMGRVVVRPLAGVTLGLSGAAFGGDSARVGGELELAWRGGWLRAEAIAQEVDGRERRDEGWYALAGYRVFPSWSLVARQEDLLRPALPAARSRHRATTLGLMWEPSGGRIKGLLDYVERSAGQDPAKSHAWIAQIQGRF